MVTSFLFGLSCLFFFLGHSTLLFFMSKEVSIMPIKELIFPRPKKGRFVSELCIGLSILSFLLMVLLPFDLKDSSLTSTLKILFAFAGFPTLSYGAYLFKRIHKHPTGLFFHASETTNNEWKIPIIVSAVVSFLFWIF